MLEDYAFPKTPEDRLKDGAILFAIGLVVVGFSAAMLSIGAIEIATLSFVGGLTLFFMGIVEMLRGWYSHRRQTRYEPLPLNAQEVLPPVPAAPEIYENWQLSSINARCNPETGTAYIVQQLVQLDAAEMEQLWQQAEYDDFSEYRSYTFPSSTGETLTLVWKRKAAPEIWPPES